MVLTVCGRVGLVDEGRTLAQPATTDDVGGVAAAGALGVVGVDGPAGDGGQGVLHEAGLVEGVGVDGHLHPGLVAHPQAGVDGGRRRAPVLVQLEARGPAPELLPQRLAETRVALAEQGDVDRQRVEGLEHPGQVPAARGHRRGPGALGRAGAAADERGDPGAERLVEDLGADEVDVAVDGAGGEDLAVAGDDLGATAR